eukprot:jgi/Chlat1/1247/Chrsp115S01691
MEAALARAEAERSLRTRIRVQLERDWDRLAKKLAETDVQLPGVLHDALATGTPPCASSLMNSLLLPQLLPPHQALMTASSTASHDGTVGTPLAKPGTLCSEAMLASLQQQLQELIAAPDGRNMSTPAGNISTPAAADIKACQGSVSDFEMDINCITDTTVGEQDICEPEDSALWLDLLNDVQPQHPPSVNSVQQLRSICA